MLVLCLVLVVFVTCLIRAIIRSRRCKFCVFFFWVVRCHFRELFDFFFLFALAVLFSLVRSLLLLLLLSIYLSFSLSSLCVSFLHPTLALTVCLARSVSLSYSFV